jgi:antitoxin component of MazEF toxin-antitoxin module
MPRAQVVKWGNSLAVRIPKAVAAEARMQEGDSILIEGVGGADHTRKPSRGD